MSFFVQAGPDARALTEDDEWPVALTSVCWGSAVELMEDLELARTGAVAAHVEMYPLDDVEDAYAALREGRIRGRAVLTP